MVVSTHLKNISQIESFPQVGVKIKHIWNHHLVMLQSPENEQLLHLKIPSPKGYFKEKHIDPNPPFFWGVPVPAKTNSWSPSLKGDSGEQMLSLFSRLFPRFSSFSGGGTTFGEKTPPSLDIHFPPAEVWYDWTPQNGPKIFFKIPNLRRYCWWLMGCMKP